MNLLSYTYMQDATHIQIGSLNVRHFLIEIRQSVPQNAIRSLKMLCLKQCDWLMKL